MMLDDGYHDVPAGKLAMVVTYLKMTTPAALRGAVLPDGLSLEPLARDVETYLDVFRRVGQDWLWFERLKTPAADLAALLHDPKVSIFTLMKNGQAEALLELDFREHGVCELAYFGLTPALIGSGAGAYLMDRAIEAAWAAEIDEFQLHTCTLDSPQAMDFYIRSGFKPYKRKIEVSEDPRTHGVYGIGVAPKVPHLK
ncbi:MAG: GNAT family N-acetyltransferase [Aliishimia sp.]